MKNFKFTKYDVVKLICGIVVIAVVMIMILMPIRNSLMEIAEKTVNVASFTSEKFTELSEKNVKLEAEIKELEDKIEEMKTNIKKEDKETITTVKVTLNNEEDTEVKILGKNKAYVNLDEANLVDEASLVRNNIEVKSVELGNIKVNIDNSEELMKLVNSTDDTNKDIYLKDGVYTVYLKERVSAEDSTDEELEDVNVLIITISAEGKVKSVQSSKRFSINGKDDDYMYEYIETLENELGIIEADTHKEIRYKNAIFYGEYERSNVKHLLYELIF